VFRHQTGPLTLHRSAPGLEPATYDHITVVPVAPTVQRALQCLLRDDGA